MEERWGQREPNCQAQLFIYYSLKVRNPFPMHSQTEEYWGNVNPIGERSCYDEGKRAAECLTMDYHREHGQEVGAIRSDGLCTALASCDCMFLHVSKRMPAAVWPHPNSTAAPLSASLPPQVRIVRIFNTYGPRMALDDGRVVSNFVSQVRPQLARLLRALQRRLPWCV